MAPSAGSHSNGGGNGASHLDQRLTHLNPPNWQHAAKQALLAPSYTIVEPANKITEEPSQVDFDLPREDHLLFGVMTKFRVKGVFQYQAANSNDWTNVPAAEASKVLLAPLWFEMLIKEMSVFHDNYRITSSQELRHCTPFLNAYLHHNMLPLHRKIMCPQAWHPAYCLPSPTDTKWQVANQAWKDYAAAAFGSAIAFDYTPLFLFPFFQGANYLTDKDMPRILPAPAMARIQIRFAFTDSHDHIFRKVDPVTNTHKYRFTFHGFNMVLEEARLSPGMDKQLRTGKKPMGFPGVTRIQLAEPVPGGSTTYRTRFQDIYMPEALFIYCLDKKVASATYKFSTDDKTTVFVPHNIESIDLSFDGKRFSHKEPHVGTFLEDELDSKSLFDKVAWPPFGIPQNTDKLSHRLTREAGKSTAFPHVYMSLVTGPDRQRLIPVVDDGSCLHKKANLELDMKFTTDNSPGDVIYVIYAIYTDVNVVYDPRNKHFFSPYLQYMN